jgi:hypothetical protein
MFILQTHWYVTFVMLFCLFLCNNTMFIFCGKKLHLHRKILPILKIEERLGECAEKSFLRVF